MKKYKGMCSYYKGVINDKIIEVESESQLLRLASKYANTIPVNQHILYVDYISVALDDTESIPLPQQYYVKLCGKKWELKGTVPEKF